MKPVLPLLFVGAVLSSCNCSTSGAALPTPVTLKFTNSSSSPVFVDATDETWGLVITSQGSAPTNPPYFESLPVPCTCLSCELICQATGCPGSVCSVPQPTSPLVEKLLPGDSVQRQWTGVYYKNSQSSCGALVGGQACLQHTNDFPDDTFTARICYALSVTDGQAFDAGVPFPGFLPSGDLVCAEKDFQPQSGEVDLTPPPAQLCDPDAGSSACPSGQLCFAGLCSSGCPANGFPVYGNGYYVNVSAPSGAFFLRTDAAANTTWSGTGTLTGVAYGGTTILYLTNAHGLTGSLDFVLPQLGTDCCFEAFHPGETLQVLVKEAPPGTGNRAIAIRDGSGQLLQVADMASPVVLTATDTAPFTVQPLSTAEGCNSVATGCRAIFAATTFTTLDGPAPTLDPGALATVTTSGATFRVLNVENITYLATSTAGSACSTYAPLVPYVILNTRP
jgi:hypothetical protein